jgi:hypothetical protein
MSWRKYFTPVPTGNNSSGSYSPFSFKGGNAAGPASANYSSYLPDVYVGSPNRIERYGQYNTMDMDSEVNAALDILAEFCTQENKENGTPFKIKFVKNATSTEVTVISQYLKQWCKLQKFETRMFRIVRNIFKYGDQFFIRDPETKRWFHIDPANVTKIIVNESEGKRPEQYMVRDLNISFESLEATKINTTTAYGPGGNTPGYTTLNQNYMTGRTPDASSSRFGAENTERAINAEHVIHISLSEGLDNNYPFGNSLLETVFKVYKQKELLEDAIIIYRVQRAPERRVFYIDVGNMPTHLAMSFVERVKTEIHQRRIPSRTGGGATVIDSTYNPLGINEDYFFPQTCLALDTKIKLLDNRDLTLQEIINEYKQGKVNYTYSVNQQTLQIEPGKIVWADVTRKNAQVVKVVLDNGESVVCTPDHRFIMKDGLEVEAQHLVNDNEIMSMNAESAHKVASVIVQEQNVDTGDITVESASNSHNFALSVGIFVHNSEGRGSKVDTLPGGSNLGEIDDLRYFTNKLLRGLRIPSSYLPTGAEEANSQYNDGRVGTAYIQELRFNNYCERLQRLITERFNNEFKLYLKDRGVNIDITMFDLDFQPPQNFASYRQAELDSNRISTFTQMSAIPYISNRFALQRFLGLSKEEMTENERMWREENDENYQVGEQDAATQMRDAGIAGSDIGSDLDNIEDQVDDTDIEAGEPDSPVPGGTTPELPTKV